MSATNFKPGDIMELAVPAGGVTTGGVYVIGGFVGIATTTNATAGARVNFIVKGVNTLPKTTGETWTEGQPLFWDATNSKLSTDLTLGLPIGAVAAAAASADTTGSVRMNGVSLCGRILNFRKRIPIATINAGATLLAAIPGLKYRLCDAFAIAIGGAVTSNTTVDLKGTQAAAAVKLVAWTQASLTQSTMVRAGGAGGTLLADGASFAPCDVNTALTIANTGSAITVATNVDVEFTYSLE